MPGKGAGKEPIIAALQQVKARAKVAKVCRQMGVSQAAFYTWRKQYGGLE